MERLKRENVHGRPLNIQRRPLLIFVAMAPKEKEPKKEKSEQKEPKKGKGTLNSFSLAAFNNDNVVI